MNLFIGQNYAALSEQACTDLISLLDSLEHPLVCTASGDSPAGLYRNLLQRQQKKELNTAHWNFVGLDEWAGMNGLDEGSCRFHLNQQLFAPLVVEESRICFFDGRASDLQAECQRTENFITANGGIDVALVGLGLNGHIGMNEPGAATNLFAHVADIDPMTQLVGQKYFSSPQVLTHGLTLGIASLMKAKHLFLLVNGAHKAGIVKEVLEGEVSEQVPASLFRNHPGLRIYLDQEAAALLNK